jgi:hypothetical protein
MELAFIGVLLALFDTCVRFANANIPLFRRRWSVEEMPELKGLDLPSKLRNSIIIRALILPFH